MSEIAHLDLLGRNPGAIDGDVLRRSDLVGVEQGIHREDVLVRPHQAETLLIADRELGDRRPPGLLERLPKNDERLGAGLLRSQVVSLVVVARVVLLQLDEVGAVYRGYG